MKENAFEQQSFEQKEKRRGKNSVYGIRYNNSIANSDVASSDNRKKTFTINSRKYELVQYK